MKYIKRLSFFLLLLNIWGCNGDNNPMNAFLLIDIDQLTWKQLHGPYSGSVSSIAINKEQEIFVCAGSVHRSRDNGDSWFRLDTGTGIAGPPIIIDSNGQIYLGSELYGLYTSIDNGNTWFETGLGSGWISGLACNSNNHIFAVRSSDYPSPFRGTLFRSMDGGDTWQALFSGLITSLAVNQNNDVFLGTYDELLISSDNGDTFFPLGDGLPNTTAVAFNINGDVIAETDRNGVYRSNDYGDTWTMILDEKTYEIGIGQNGEIWVTTLEDLLLSTDHGDTWNSIETGYDERAYSIRVTAEGDILCGLESNGIIRSSNNGEDWSQIGINQLGVRSIAFDSGGYVYIGEYYSRDNGQTWIKTGVQYAYSVAIDTQDHIYVSGTGGIHYSADHGQTWINRGQIGSHNSRNIALNSKEHLFSDVRLEGLFRSTDEGSSWIQVFPSTATVHFVFIDKNDHIYIGNDDGIHRSIDNGENWFFLGAMDITAYSLAINPEGVLFCANPNSGIYRSTDDGITWSHVGLQGKSISKITYEQGYLFVAGDGLYYSNDNGDTWSQFALSESYEFYTLSISPEGVLFAGSRYDGVFKAN